MRTIEMVVPVVEILRAVLYMGFLIGISRDSSQFDDPALEMQPTTQDPEKNLSPGIGGRTGGDRISDCDMRARHRRKIHRRRCKAETSHGRGRKDLDRTRSH